MGCFGSKSQTMNITQPGDTHTKASKKKVSDHVSGLPRLDLKLKTDEKVKAELPPPTPSPVTPSAVKAEAAFPPPPVAQERPPVPSRTKPSDQRKKSASESSSSASSSDEEKVNKEKGIQRRALDLLDEGRLNEAHSVLVNGIEQMSPEDAETGVTETVLAVVLLQQGRLREAKNTLEKLVDGNVGIPPELKENVIDTLDFIAQGQLAEAKSQIRESVEKYVD